MRRRLSTRLAFGLALLLSACHHASPGAPDGGGVDDLSASSDLAEPLVITPANPVIMVGPTNKVHTVTFTATIGGRPVDATWSTDREELGGFASSTDPTYTTTGNLGGKGTITATYKGIAGQTSVTVQYVDTGENGDPVDPSCTFDTSTVNIIGKGGYGGVGGDGPGCTASNAQSATLMGTPTADASVVWLYPYDQTVWPKGQLAPLLMWNPGAHHFDSLRLQMSAKGGTYVYDGVFAAPHSIGAAGFINLPIPQGVWQTMNQSSVGDLVTITVTLGEGAQAYGPLSVKWIIATGVLSGTVYYNSYGTGVGTPSSPSTPMTNSGEKDQSNPPAEFAAGVLGIRPGKTDPVLIAGQNSPGSPTGCRVCHTVSRDGSSLISQASDASFTYQMSELENLKSATPSTMETGFTKNASMGDVANSAFSAIYPDGTLLFTSSGGVINGDSASRLYTLPDGQLAANVMNAPPQDFQAAMPSFAPDGSQLVFNWYGGVGSDEKSLATMTFDASTRTLGAVTKLLTPAGGLTAVWPSFLPGQVGVLYELETHEAEFGNTRNGALAHLEWVDAMTKTEGTLDRLNGVGYLPTATMHTDDAELNYEPTVNPVASGGYAWVVFTSRRLYGNVATQDPTLSDPRLYDWKHNITTKKLWVAAIDLNAKPGSDPSHPAFYLPAQELFAGNSRGFWTVDPCKSDGTSCETGDECCGGYCSNMSASPGDGGALALSCSSTKNGCAALNEKCKSSSDCCPLPPQSDPTGATQPICVNGYCAESAPPPIQ